MKQLELRRQLFKISSRSIIFLMLVLIISQFNLADYFPIRKIRVYGVNRLDQVEVQNALSPLVDHGFFTINVDYIHDRLKQIAWIADLHVRRVWPDQIVIRLSEKDPVAYWNDNTLLSQNGEVFSPKQESWPTGLPKFSGPEGQQLFMLKNFLDMNRLLLPLHAKISYLELTPFLTWKLKLDNGITMQAGHKDVLTRLNQFVKVYPKIIGTRVNDVDYIDLRYANGFAVRWKEMG